MSFLVPILILVLGICAIVIAIGADRLRSTWKRHRPPPELRGDWWARFDREFRAYAEQTSKAAQEARRRAREKRSPPG